MITTSVDGHVKFWKKQESGIEFVKHFRSHLGVIVSADVSPDGMSFCTASVDMGLKVFDVINFDMINMFKLDYLPHAVCWIYAQGSAKTLLACSEKDSGKIHIYDGRGGSELLKTVDNLHSHPVHLMRFNPIDNVVVSCDESGMLEFWTPDLEKGYVEPTCLKWKFKSDTDLYAFKKVGLKLTS